MTTTFRAARELATLVVTGKDRLTWLNGLVTCDLAKAKPGDGIYGLAVAKNGRILADIWFVVDEAKVVLAVPRSEVEKLRAHADRHLIMEDAEIGADADAYAVLFVDGGAAAAALAAARGAGAIGGAADLGGEGGAIVLAPREKEAEVVRAIEGVGAAREDDAAWDTRRVARGVPRFGADFDETTYPQEAALEKRAVSFCKGCYLGQEVVCMLEMRGHVKRKLVVLSVEGAAPARGAVVTDEAGGAVGEITSAAGGAALAMVKRASATAGARVKVGDQSATVVAA